MRTVNEEFLLFNNDCFNRKTKLWTSQLVVAIKNFLSELNQIINGQFVWDQTCSFVAISGKKKRCKLGFFKQTILASLREARREVYVFTSEESMLVALLLCDATKRVRVL